MLEEACLHILEQLNVVPQRIGQDHLPLFVCRNAGSFPVAVRHIIVEGTKGLCLWREPYVDGESSGWSP